MDTLFTKTSIKKSLALEAKHINNKLDDHILSKIKNNYEGRCLKYGYIKPNSIHIIKRSIGNVLTSHLNGSILYNVEFSADICNPLEGSIIEVQVKNKNKMGVLAGIIDEDNSPLNILLARQHHINHLPNEFMALNVDDTISVKVIGKRFEYGHNQISIIGLLHE
jgi:DNA-directed RNA polymerase subunit E'/Rpb7